MQTPQLSVADRDRRPALISLRTTFSSFAPSTLGMNCCSGAENGLSDDRKHAFLEALSRDQGANTRVLSIQSHVVSGYAGNKCAIFPLQLHGFEVDFINSVQFSNHTAHKHLRGQRLAETELAELYEGLKINDINNYSHVLTGYCGNPTFLRKIIEVVADIKKKNPNVLFVCDPVLGDNGAYYTPKELMPIYRDEVIPFADVLTPNVFELQEITGRKIESEKDCIEAIAEMHRKGVKIVVVTSGMFDSPEKKIMHCYASVKTGEESFEQYRFEIPVLQGRFVGTGDVFASLLIVWLHIYNNDLTKSVSNVISSIQALLHRTIKQAYGGKSPEEFTPTAAEVELQLVQSRMDLLAPSIPVNFIKLA